MNHRRRLEDREQAIMAIPSVDAVVFADANGLPLRQYSRSERHGEKIAAMTAGLISGASRLSFFDGRSPTIRISAGNETFALGSCSDGVMVCIMFRGILSDQELTACMG